MEDGVIIALHEDEGWIATPVALDTLVGGKFHFSFLDTINTTKPMLISGFRNGFPPSSLAIWVRPGAKIEITGTDKLVRTWNVKSNVREQLEANEYIVKNKEHHIRYQEIIRDVSALRDEIR